MRKLLLLLLLPASGLLLQGCGHLVIAAEHDHPRHPHPYDHEVVYHDHHDAVIVHHGDRPPFVPPGHLPPPGHARVWHPNRPPGHQPPPFRVH